MRRVQLQQQRATHPGSFIITCLPAVLLAVFLEGLVLTRVLPWQHSVTMTGILLVPVIVSLSNVAPTFHERWLLRGYSMLVSCAFLLLVVISQVHGIIGAGTLLPGIFLLLACIAHVLQTRYLNRKQRLSALGATILFLVLLYAVDGSGYWWQWLLISLVVCGAVTAVLTRFPLRRRHLQRRILRYLYLLTILAVVSSLIIGLVGASPTYIWGLGAACVSGGIDVYVTKNVTLRDRIILWSGVNYSVILIIAISFLFLNYSWWELLIIIGAFAMSAYAHVMASKPPRRYTTRRTRRRVSYL